MVGFSSRLETTLRASSYGNGMHDRKKKEADQCNRQEAELDM